MFELQRRQIIILAALAAVLVFGGGYKYAQMQNNDSNIAEGKPTLEQFEDPGQQDGAKEVVVHVTGAVQKPGLYRLPAGARVADAVEKAIPNADAALDLLNLAALVPDEYKLVVPDKQAAAGPAAVPAPGSGGAVAARENPFTAPAGGASTAAGSLTSSGRVNLNTAGQSELETLPGIGPSLAQRIIQYRQTSGPFRTPEDLKNVSGIGDKRFEQLKDLITVY